MAKTRKSKRSTSRNSGGANATNRRIIQELIRSYWLEMETVQNYLANSQNLDGVRAEEVKKSLAADVTAELGHAQQLASRIRVLGGTVPGSFEYHPEQRTLQPPDESTDVVAVIKGVIDAENGAIDQYQKIIELCDGVDYPTQDMAIGLLADEQQHRREFLGFLAEYEQENAERRITRGRPRPRK